MAHWSGYEQQEAQNMLDLNLSAFYPPQDNWFGPGMGGLVMPMPPPPPPHRVSDPCAASSAGIDPQLLWTPPHQHAPFVQEDDEEDGEGEEVDEVDNATWAPVVPAPIPIPTLAAHTSGSDNDAEGSEDEYMEDDDDDDDDDMSYSGSTGASSSVDHDWIPAAPIRQTFTRSPTAASTSVPDDVTVVASPVHKGLVAAGTEWVGLEDDSPTQSKRTNRSARNRITTRRSGPPQKTTTIRSFHCSYVGCVSSYSRKAELDRHRKKHLDKPELRCEVCDGKISGGRKDALRRHKINTLECVTKQKTFTDTQLTAMGCFTRQQREEHEKKKGTKGRNKNNKKSKSISNKKGAKMASKAAV